MNLTPLLSDHAIVQRHQAIPVWGWTSQPRTRIQANLGPGRAEGISGDDCRFLLRLPALDAGGPHTLIVESLDGSERLEVGDILVGEVWLASGQSNMEWTMAASEYKDEIAAAQPRQIRMLNVEQRAHLAPQSAVKGEWKLATPGTFGNFSAVANFFAQRLQDELKVPVGIINSSWGGSFIETWISRERLLCNPDARAWLLEYEAAAHSPAGWMRRDLESILPADPGNHGVESGWHCADFNDSDWETMRIPSRWQEHGHNYSAVMWFRKRVSLPESMQGKDLTLHLGAVDKQDITYANGVEVGRTGEGFDESLWYQPREYTLPAELTRGPELVIAVRAYSFCYDGGVIGPDTHMRITQAGDDDGEAVSLAGDWHFQIEHNFGFIDMGLEMGHNQHNSPYMCFENMIKPLLPVGIAGAIWYQGESNAGNPNAYRRLLRDLVEDWRFHFGLGDFPFGVVQLPIFMQASDLQLDSTWAPFREAQADVLNLPHTGLAVTLEAGEADDIHPKDKKTVGTRLAQWALAEVYGRNLVAGGPRYRGHRMEGKRIRVLFSNVGEGLSLAEGDRVRTLFVADKTGKFHPAQSAIEGASLLVWHESIDTPTTIRYAWADNPENANVVNSIGYPLAPFRTDR